MTKIADGVYYATSNGPMATGGNHPIIVNEHDVMLVDDGTTPAAARALLEDLKLITNKPVRWVVNTHFHYDHTDGNSIFGPEVQIIGHEYVRRAIMDDVLHHEPFMTALSNMPIQVECAEKTDRRRKGCRKAGHASGAARSDPGGLGAVQDHEGRSTDDDLFIENDAV